MESEPSPLNEEHRLKPKLIKSNNLKRRLIILSYWLIFLFIGIPFWFNSTSIERLNLPNYEINLWQIKFPCYLRPNIDLKVSTLSNPVGIRLLGTVIQVLEKEFSSECLNFKVDTSEVDVSTSSDERESEKHRYELLLGEENKLDSGRKGIAALDGTSREKSLANVRSVVSNLLDLKTEALDPRIVKFSSHYKLVFSLLNQDSSCGKAILDWDIETLLSRHIQPLLTSLAPLHNFTIETQIQYFAPLTINVEKQSEGEGSTIDEVDLKAFVNPADWNMPSSETLDPILQFIVYVPSPSNRPLKIKESTGSISLSNAFMTPQWGGVTIFNPSSEGSMDSNLLTKELSIPFRHFEKQLYILLGIPTPPPSLPFINSNGGSLATWQIDALVRRRLRESTRECIETLGSLIQLVEDTPNMRVGEEVLRDVKSALAELNLAEVNLVSSPSTSLYHSANALRLASRAYFNPTMLALLYFPEEHKYAVYTPFFGPIAVPMLGALFKEWKLYRSLLK